MKRLHPLFFAAAALLLAACGSRNAASLFDPWQGAENTETMLFLARDGERAPEGFEGQTVEAGVNGIRI